MRSTATTRTITTEELASLSHEFRTPLNGVLGMARLLDGTRLDAEQRTYVAALRESGEHLLGLVNDLLDFAKLGEGKIDLDLQRLDVEQLLRSVCELLSPRAREKGLEIAWAVDRDVGVLLADEGRLRQILLNLAGNAVKFTQAGGVLVSVAARRGRRLRFVVEDSGPGVPKAMREQIFEAFAQAGPAASGEKGAGLGLAIVRRLAQAMDGQVGVLPARGGGSAFWFEAPFERAAEVRVIRPLAGLTVGVASPNRMVREGASRQVAAGGGTPRAAVDVESLLAQTGPGDVVLLDYALAAAAGGGFAPPPGRKAIVLLAPEERSHIDGCREAGFAGYLIKPLRRGSLSERVLAAAGDSGAAAPGAEDERIVTAAAPGARVLLVEDNPINTMLARTLLTREGCSIDHARAGEEAVAAIQVGTYDLILMDMRMPGMSGVEATKLIRAQGVKTPIVALTANAFADDRQDCLAAGMDDFLVKPLSPDALRAVLTQWVSARWTESATHAKVG